MTPPFLRGPSIKGVFLVKKIITIGLLVLLGVTLFVVGEIRASNTGRLDYNRDQHEFVTDTESTFYNTIDYYNYLTKNTLTFPDQDPLIINGAEYVDSTGDVEVYEEYEGKEDVVLTDEIGTISWAFNVPESGYYNLYLNYYPYEGKSSMIERSLSINGEEPFDGARTLTFQRVWGNAQDIIQDIHGNDIRPSQIEKPMWTGAYFKDSVGYVNEPYQFYFDGGDNTITLESIREPLMIESIELRKVEETPSYEDVKAMYEANNYEVAEGDITLKQAEEPAYTTSPTLYPLADLTSPMTQPASPTLEKLNTIGGNNWRIANDKITWEFEVPEDGLYNISLRLKQSLASGMNVNRNIYINGEIPFEELKNYQFPHATDFRIQTLGSQEEAYLFYFESGQTHTISMEVSLGSYGALIAQIQSSIENLNALYREILVYTGPEPDMYRDYQLEERIPNLTERFENEQGNLELVRNAIKDIADTNSEKTGILDTVLLQLDDFIETPREIHRNLNEYNGNIASLGTLIIMLSEQPLQVDYFVFHEPGADLPSNRANIFRRLSYNIQSFVSTFITDYTSIGKTQEAGEDDITLEVWLTIGRDQANILRKLIDETFTKETGIQVDLKLVSQPALLPATLAGEGPDIAMGVPNDVPVNYAMRNATYDLTNFSDFDEITPRFKDSAMVPFNYEDGYYGLPEQQIFLMMFFRTDIFEELDLEVPDTWDKVIQLIPDLQKHNLEFYLPVPITQGQVVNLPPNPIYSSILYQNDGDFYINNNNESGFNEGKAPQVFETWTQFYTDYSFPVEANFVNRFRSGQMPIGINYYNQYNVLSVFAPEIRGKWDFVPIPGTIDVDEDGNEYIRRDTVATGTSAVIMESSEEKEAAWEYLKWWTDTDTQIRFGREMEGILGAAARYPTANVEAMQALPWTVKEYSRLEQQWDDVQGIPEVPGGYMTGRHLDNAFRLVLEDSSNPRETIYDYVQIINEELARKRREFGLE